MSDHIGEREIEQRMVVIGADATLVGDVLDTRAGMMVVQREPLPRIILPLELVALVGDGVVVLHVPGEFADAAGERFWEKSRTA